MVWDCERFSSFPIGMCVFCAAQKESLQFFRTMQFQHLQKQNLTYLQHLRQAWSISCHLAKASLQCFVHGVYPDLWETAASDTVKRLHTDLFLLKKRTE